MDASKKKGDDVQAAKKTRVTAEGIKDSVETTKSRRSLHDKDSADDTDIFFATADPEEEEDRETWSGRFDFLLSMIGNAVGLGNVWRFPYMAYENGGAPFLIPYFICMFVIGISGILIECAVGQYSGMSTAHAFSNAVPLFKGLGIAALINCICIMYFYNAIIAWCYYYMFASFNSSLPWSECSHDYNTERCFSSYKFMEECVVQSKVYLNKTCLEAGEWQAMLSNVSRWYSSTLGEAAGEEDGDDTPCIFTNTTFCDASPGASQGITKLFHLPGPLRSDSAKEYFEKSVLKVSSSLGELGSPDLYLVGCIALTWIINFLCLVKGIKSSGKVVYFTATFPYVVILILLVRAATLDGAIEGINMYMLAPKWEYLAEWQTWIQAAGQILFSLSNANGTMTTLASYNRFHSNIVFNVFFVCIANCLTSFVAGFAIFGTIGYLAQVTEVAAEDAAGKGGAGLAFIVYPSLVSTLPWSNLWSFLFFFMLITLGLDSSMCLVEAISTFLVDSLPWLRARKTLVTAAVCASSFLLSIFLACPAASHIIDLIDGEINLTLIYVAFLTVICMAFFYGVGSLVDDLVEMTRMQWLYTVRPVFYLFYYCLAPLSLGLLLVGKLYKYEWFSQVKPAIYEPWADYIGMTLITILALTVPLGAGVVLIQHRDDLPTVVRSTNKWRKNALKQHQVDSSEGEETGWSYSWQGDRLVRERREEADE